MSEKILLIDGHSILNRAFYGLPDLTNSEGKHTGAVYGFLNILLRTIEEEKPQYLTVAFDLKAPTFRHKMFEAYKGTRKPMPEELREQVPLIKEMLTAMGVNVVTKEGYLQKSREFCEAQESHGGLREYVRRIRECRISLLCRQYRRLRLLQMNLLINIWPAPMESM